MTAKVTQADVYAYIAKAKQLMKQKAASASGKTKAHYELLLKDARHQLKIREGQKMKILFLWLMPILLIIGSTNEANARSKKKKRKSKNRTTD